MSRIVCRPGWKTHKLFQFMGLWGVALENEYDLSLLAVHASGDGTVYVAGTLRNAAWLARLDAQGAVLWAYRDGAMAEILLDVPDALVSLDSTGDGVTATWLSRDGDKGDGTSGAKGSRIR